jgi:hypothetical protein
MPLAGWLSSCQSNEKKLAGFLQIVIQKAPQKATAPFGAVLAKKTSNAYWTSSKGLRMFN